MTDNMTVFSLKWLQGTTIKTHTNARRRRSHSARTHGSTSLKSGGNGEKWLTYKNCLKIASTTCSFVNVCAKVKKQTVSNDFIIRKIILIPFILNVKLNNYYVQNIHSISNFKEDADLSIHSLYMSHFLVQCMVHSHLHKIQQRLSSLGVT